MARGMYKSKWVPFLGVYTGMINGPDDGHVYKFWDDIRFTVEEKLAKGSG
jgi:hypothetical protein